MRRVGCTTSASTPKRRYLPDSIVPAIVRTILTARWAKAAMTATIMTPGTASAIALLTCLTIPAIYPVRWSAHGRVYGKSEKTKRSHSSMRTA
jgi:hypothetical protein